MRKREIKKFTGVLAALLSAFLWLFSPASGEGADTVSLFVPETVQAYESGRIMLLSPAEGQAELRLLDMLDNCWLTVSAFVQAGQNAIAWDGTGAYGEQLMSGTFRWQAEVRTAGGETLRAEHRFRIQGAVPTLVYALPSSETLYLDGGEKWFVECFVTSECRVEMEVLQGNECVFRKETTLKDEDGDTLSWAGKISGSTRIAPGEYTVRFRSKQNPGYAHVFPLTVEEKTPELTLPESTGPILPERGMTDAEIWDIMRQPSVVIAGKGSFLRIDLYEKPSSRSAVIGSLRCATQALEVLGREGNWTRVRAWSHTDGQCVTGYIQTRKLTVARPSGHYGVLVDKREQTLTLFEDGRAVATIPVSTGLAVGRDTYRETPAGAFLTDVHFAASFAQEGYRYDYPLRYDAGNILHSVGYLRRGTVSNGSAKDYGDMLPELGQKASHGCVRISPFSTPENPLNIYWLWTHLPYHTRVLILED